MNILEVAKICRKALVLLNVRCLSTNLCRLQERFVERHLFLTFHRTSAFLQIFAASKKFVERHLFYEMSLNVRWSTFEGAINSNHYESSRLKSVGYCVGVELPVRVCAHLKEFARSPMCWACRYGRVFAHILNIFLRTVGANCSTNLSSAPATLHFYYTYTYIHARTDAHIHIQ